MANKLENEIAIWDAPKIQRLHSFYNKFKEKNYIQRVPEKPLYHYTNAAGLKGIITSKKIWLTDIRFMNDANELTYAISLIRSIIKESEHVNEDHKAFFDKLKDFSDPFGDAFNVYAACFCEEGALLSQWRNYGIYSIGFDVTNTIRIEKHPRMLASWMGAIMRKVIYKKKKQEQILRALIDQMFKLFKSQLGTSHKSYEQLAQDYALNFANYIMEFVLSFKDEVFSEEREWRIIHYELKGKLPNILKLREKGDYLVPYVELGLCALDDAKYEEFTEDQVLNAEWEEFFRKNGKLPIKDIIIGPDPNGEIARESVSILLKKHGFDNVVLDSKNTKYRKFW